MQPPQNRGINLAAYFLGGEDQGFGERLISEEF